MLQPVIWCILAATHAMPALAVFHPSMIGRLYRVDSTGPMFVLLRHRAALFLIIVVICLWAAFDPGSRQLASVAVGFSMTSFLIIWASAGSPATLRPIAIADLIGLPFLAFVAFDAFAAS